MSPISKKPVLHAGTACTSGAWPLRHRQRCSAEHKELVGAAGCQLLRCTALAGFGSGSFSAVSIGGWKDVQGKLCSMPALPLQMYFQAFAADSCWKRDSGSVKSLG